MAAYGATGPALWAYITGLTGKFMTHSDLPDGPGSGYQDLGWRPRLAFEAMAKLKAG